MTNEHVFLGLLIIIAFFGISVQVQIDLLEMKLTKLIEKIEKKPEEV